mgnify:CR=1 FL=1
MDESPRSTEFVALGHAGSEHYAGIETFPNPGVSHVQMTIAENKRQAPATARHARIVRLPEGSVDQRDQPPFIVATLEAGAEDVNDLEESFQVLSEATDVVPVQVGLHDGVHVFAPDGALLVFSAELGTNAGLYVYDLTDPRAPTFLDSALVATGLHTATVALLDESHYCTVYFVVLTVQNDR